MPRERRQKCEKEKERKRREEGESKEGKTYCRRMTEEMEGNKKLLGQLQPCKCSSRDQFTSLQLGPTS